LNEKNTPASRLLETTGITRERVLDAIMQLRGGQRVTDPQAETRYRTLEKYSRDLTQQAREGKLDPVIGRDKEIFRVMQILSRRTKNNPVLIGEAGVGKTAIVEGLAEKIAANDVKAGHSASTFYLSPADLFYLQTRGLSQVQIKALVINSVVSQFMADIADIKTKNLLLKLIKNRSADLELSQAKSA